MTLCRAASAALAVTISLGAAAQQPKPKGAAPADEPEEIATWIGNRFLQTASPFVNDKGIFEGTFNHRFYQPVIEAGGGNLFGLDSGTSVHFSMDYAIVKN